MIVKSGIDVSKHNGTINWDQVKGSNYGDFAILRAGLGRVASQKDKQFERNYSECKRLGIPVGAYWYSYAKSANEATLEAKACLEVIKGKTFEYPIYFDIEDKTQIGLGKEVWSSMIKAFCEVLENAGYFVGVYSSRSFFQTHIDGACKTSYTSWVAEWGSKLNYTEPADIWQKSDKGTVPGIQGRVDLDECYRDFPSIIKNAGKNGFTKTSNPVVNPAEANTEPKKPVETTVKPVEKTESKSSEKPVVAKGLFDVNVICNSLNMRTGPSISAKSVGIARNGETYTIVEEKNGWGKIKDKNLWISILSKYVKKL